jgi:predicted nucleotidyltransferase
MSSGPVNPALATRLPLDRIADICRRYGVPELSVYGPGAEEDTGSEGEVLFLVTSQNDDFGPWGSKFDELENDLSGISHEKVHVASRQGIDQSSSPAQREHILANAQRIYES